MPRPPNSPDDPGPPPGRPADGRWRAGTLAYTGAGLAALFGWLLCGDLVWSLKERSVMPVVQLLLKHYGASDTNTGFLVGSLPAALGVLLGPVLAYRSDRHRGRWGRRIPYLFLTVPVAALALVGLAASPWVGRAGGPGGIIVSLGLSWTLFEFASVVTIPIYNGLINDVVPEPVIGRFYGMFRAVSLIAGMVFNFYLLDLAATHHVALFLGIAVLYCLGVTATCLRVREGDYGPPPPAPARPGLIGAAEAYVRECFSEPYYLLCFAALTLAWLSFTTIPVFILYYAQSVHLDLGTYGKLVTLQYAISLAASYGLGWLADRFHPLRVVLVILGLNVIVSLWGGLRAIESHTFAVAMVAEGVLSGAYLTANGTLAQRLYPKARFAQFASANSLVMAFGSFVAALGLGALLDRAHHAYRLTFLASFSLTLAAIAANLLLYRWFVALGGPRNYVAPE